MGGNTSLRVGFEILEAQARPRGLLSLPVAADDPDGGLSAPSACILPYFLP